MGVKTVKRNKKMKLAPRRLKKLKHNKNIKFVPSGSVDSLSHAGIRFHKGYVYDKLRYTVLTYTQMTQADRAFVEAKLKTITNASQAKTLPAEPGWACTALDMHGRSYIVSYHGIEVALFFKRQLTEIKPEPGDRFPEGVLQEPEDAWQRLDLMGVSAKRANLVLTKTMEQFEADNKLYLNRISTLEALNDQLEEALKSKENARAKAVKKLTEKQKKTKPKTKKRRY